MRMTNYKQEDLAKREVNLEEVNEKKSFISNEIRRLKERINEASVNSTVENLVSLLEASKNLESQESEVLSRCIVEHSKLQAVVNEFEQMSQSSNGGEGLFDVDDCLQESDERLNLAKKELAYKLRAILLLKRQIDDVPIPAELIQYELRFSELYSNIQRKLRQTRKCYETFNALLEIKELTLKETSLLNSISSQFQDAIASPIGRSKLIESMEGILQGIEQKLERTQLSLESEQKTCETFRKKYTKSLSEQRQCYALLKAFQEECARNERLRAQTPQVFP